MSRSPINLCVICGKPIVKMRKIALTGRFKGKYTLGWSKAKCCSRACYQMEYRKRKKMNTFRDIINRNI